MQTYTEYQLLKQAGGDDAKSNYQLIHEKKQEGNKAVMNALSTSAPGEVVWSLLGAGLGAGGGYLASRWLRRNGTKKQRALDIVIGALIGAGGSNILMDTQAGDHGLTHREVMRADQWLDPDGSEGTNDKKPTSAESPYDPNFNNLAGAGGGFLLGGAMGKGLGLAEGAMSSRAAAKAAIAAQKEALGLGFAQGTPNFNYHVQTRMDAARAAGARRGGKLDFFGGGMIGAGLGYWGGSKLNERAAAAANKDRITLNTKLQDL